MPIPSTSVSEKPSMVLMYIAPHISKHHRIAKVIAGVLVFLSVCNATKALEPASNESFVTRFTRIGWSCVFAKTALTITQLVRRAEMLCHDK